MVPVGTGFQEGMDLLGRASSRGSPVPPLTCRSPILILAAALYLVDMDGDVNDDEHQVSQSQAGYEDIRAGSHALVLANDSQQCGVSDDTHHEH